jgi:D-alanyl-D-alanine carboxypeptidase/D-alanyl-D-alanine-endopeptidase (penicillin-binding protein 4)
VTGPEVEGSDDVVRPGTGVVRPGSVTGAAGAAGVVRPGAVRPGTDVVRPDTAPDGAAKAVAAVPEAPSETPVEPIHVVLPVIPVKEVKQGFLDRLVAGKTDAEKVEEAARKEEEARRRAEEAQRKADEKALREQDEADRKADEKARKEALEARREAREVRRAEVEADRKARAEAEERARKQAEKARRADEKERREQEKALRRDTDEDEDEEEYEEPVRRPQRSAPAPLAPPRPGTAPPRPGPRQAPAPARPMPGRGGRAPQRTGVERYDEYDGYERRRRPLWHWAVGAAALVALGGGSAVVATVVAPPGAVTYQGGIDTGVQAPMLAGLNGVAAVPSRSGLDAAIGPLLDTPNLGPSPAVTVADAAKGQVLWDRNGDAPMKPASAAKVLTAAAVLATRGPTYRIPTRVVAGANPGDVVLVGGGDPSLAISENSYFRGAARLDLLAQEVRRALGTQTPTRVLIDTSLFSGPTVGPSGSGNVGSQVANVTALMVDGGRTNLNSRGESGQFSPQPDVAAGQAFAAALGLPASAVVPGSAPANPRVLGQALSPPIASIVEQMLAESDNTAAEMMARQVALAKNLPASFDGGAEATRRVLADIGLPMPSGTGLRDGSGLSHDDRVTTNQLVAILLKAASPDSPHLRPILSGLAVAGYSGTMDDDHQRSRAGRGTTRAKTGTLSGVNALAGVLVDADGRLLIFAAIGNDTPNKFVAEPALDRIAERLTRCGCS